MTTAPAASVIVVTHNHAPFVRECLASIARQTSDDFETIVIDNCSTDGTADLVRRWREDTARDVRVLVNPRPLTLCENRNQFLRLARGEWVASLSGDDFYEPDRLARQLAFARTLPPEAAVIFGQARVVSEGGAPVGLWFEGWPTVPDGHVFGDLIVDNFVSAPTAMIRRSAIAAVGGYDEGLFYEDYDMFLRLADRFEFRYLPGIVTNYRLSATGASRAPEHAAAMSASTARLLLKWSGRARPFDRVIERRARFHAWRAYGFDRAAGLGALVAVGNAHPTWRNRLSARLAAWPAVHPVISGVHRLVRRVKARRRHRAARHGRRAFP